MSVWTPNRFQRKFLALWLARGPHNPVVAAMAGWGVGKTRLVAMLMQVQAETQAGVPGAYVTDSMGRGAKTVGQEIGKLLEPIGWTLHGATAGAPAPHWISPEYGGARTTVWALSWKRHATQHKSANSLEGPDLGWVLIDECNALRDDEVARAAWGRVRSGTPPQIGLLGKPRHGAWWLKYAAEHGGVGFRAPSTCNRENLPNYDDWADGLSPREYAENALCMPQPPDGAVYSGWSDALHPAGNLAPEAWRAEPGMRTWVALDFGARSPAGLVISHDPRLGADGCDVVWAEAHPDDASIHDLCRMLLRHVWPVRYFARAPAGSIPLHGGAADRAGRNRNTLLTTDLDEVARRPEYGGLGVHLAITDEPERVDVINGIRVVARRICDRADERRLLCTPALWRGGLDCDGRSLAKSLTGYMWATGARGLVARKDDVNDHACDALRYWHTNLRWPTSVDMTAVVKSAHRRGLGPTGAAAPSER